MCAKAKNRIPIINNDNEKSAKAKTYESQYHLEPCGSVPLKGCQFYFKQIDRKALVCTCVESSAFLFLQKWIFPLCKLFSP